MLFRQAASRAVQRDFRPFAHGVGDRRNALLRQRRAGRNQLVIARRHGDAVRLQHVGVDIQALPVQANRRKQHASVAFRHRGHLFRTAVRRGGEQFIHADQLIRRQSAAQRHNDDIRPAGGHHLLHLLHEHVVLKPGIILHEIARLIFPGGDQIHVALCGKIHIRKRGERRHRRSGRQRRKRNQRQTYQQHQTRNHPAHC